MGNCKYCGKPAGLLKNRHKECQSAYDTGITSIKDLIGKTLDHTTNLVEMKQQIYGIATQGYIVDDILRRTIHDGWAAAIEKALEDDVLSQQEEKTLLKLAEIFDFDQEALNEDPAYIKIIQGCVLREICEGKIPSRLKTTNELPFNFQSKEQVVWVFRDAKYYEMRSRTSYEGGYHGIGIRVAKGLYYRTGAFRGNPVVTTQTMHLDTGIIAVTNQHIYFAGQKKQFRIKYNKIVAFTPYSNGMGIQKDAQTAKPQMFEVGDGWFIYNLITNLAKMSVEK